MKRSSFPKASTELAGGLEARRPLSNLEAAWRHFPRHCRGGLVIPTQLSSTTPRYPWLAYPSEGIRICYCHGHELAGHCSVGIWHPWNPPEWGPPVNSNAAAVSGMSARAMKFSFITFSNRLDLNRGWQSGEIIRVVCCDYCGGVQTLLTAASIFQAMS